MGSHLVLHIPNNTESERRFGIFKKIYEAVDNFNSQEEGRNSLRKGINKFSDMTSREFSAMYFEG